MTELAEMVAIFKIDLDKDPLCENKKQPNPGWTVVIDGIKGEGKAEILKNNMNTPKKNEPNDPKKLSGDWDLFDCGINKFPKQTHHLICEKYLPKHPVTVWLTDSPEKEVKDKEYILESDTSYDTNGAKNGFFMPFASNTSQWKGTENSTKRNLICYEMMRRTRIQLHQGPHSFTDYMEQEDVETKGYKTMLDNLLTMICDRMKLHLVTCVACKSKKKDGLIPVQPLEATVRQMELVSQLLKTLIGFWRIAVSRRAASYYEDNNKQRSIKHRTTPFITRQEI